VAYRAAPVGSKAVAYRVASVNGRYFIIVYNIYFMFITEDNIILV
jgi:hypothetical protein